MTRFTEREDTGIIDLDVTIYCEKASHKGIIIGKHGAMLKRISSPGPPGHREVHGRQGVHGNLGKGQGKLAG